MRQRAGELQRQAQRRGHLRRERQHRRGRSTRASARRARSAAPRGPETRPTGRLRRPARAPQQPPPVARILRHRRHDPGGFPHRRPVRARPRIRPATVRGPPDPHRLVQRGVERHRRPRRRERHHGDVARARRAGVLGLRRRGAVRGRGHEPRRLRPEHGRAQHKRVQRRHLRVAAQAPRGTGVARGARGEALSVPERRAQRTGGRDGVLRDGRRSQVPEQPGGARGRRDAGHRGIGEGGAGVPGEGGGGPGVDRARGVEAPGRAVRVAGGEPADRAAGAEDGRTEGEGRRGSGRRRRGRRFRENREAAHSLLPRPRPRVRRRRRRRAHVAVPPSLVRVRGAQRRLRHPGSRGMRLRGTLRARPVGHRRIRLCVHRGAPAGQGGGVASGVRARVAAVLCERTRDRVRREGDSRRGGSRVAASSDVQGRREDGGVAARDAREVLPGAQVARAHEVSARLGRSEERFDRRRERRRSAKGGRERCKRRRSDGGVDRGAAGRAVGDGASRVGDVRQRQRRRRRRQRQQRAA